MRITGQGSGGGQSPTGKDRSDPEAFRRGRKVGQIVRGRLEAPATGGLFWVVIAGHKLLASLDHEPVPGRELVFRIERLEPELTLKDITPLPSAQSDPVLLLSALAEARSRFETLLHPFTAPNASPLNLTESRIRFSRYLVDNPAAKAAFDKTRELFRLAMYFLPPGQGRLLYVPWVFADLTQSEMMLTPLPRGNDGPGFSLRLFGRLPDIGLVFVQASWHPGTVVYRFLAERPKAADGVLAALSSIRFGRAELAPKCLFAGELTKAQAAGIIAPLLAGTARPFTGLRLRV
ncbi:MAG: hypothetical protein AB9872_00640 [Solidesulfovibrio sp.]